MIRLITYFQRLAFCVVTVAILIPTGTIAEERQNSLPMKEHKTSDAQFLSPTQAVAKMAIPDGFEVSIFAAEPDIAEPIAFCFDARGRMWIAENFNYQTRQHHSDDQVSRIQILEDSDGDGVFDHKKTFTDKLTFISGIAHGFGGVFVGTPPHLSFIPDANGDDRPDAAPQPLLDGWGTNDRHETLNSFIWGPDGWLYGCHGVFTQSNVGLVGATHSQRQSINGGIWRYHPTRKTFEIFARGLSNPWGFDFDDHGQAFATCCVIPHLFHIVQGGFYDKQSLPHENPHVYEDIKTIRDHTHLSAHGGARFYLGDVFPKQYRNQLFMCNIHEHAVLTDVMVPKGSGFIGKHGQDFMPTHDLAWVGFSVEVGPDGGVYILDWHDTDICGNAVNFPNSGRVYRIMPKDSPIKRRLDLTSLSDEELAELQRSDNDWYVRQARVLLQSRTFSKTLNGSIVHSRLNEQFDDAATSAKRLRALWALNVTQGLSRDRLVALLSHDDAYVRAWTIQIICDTSPIHAFQIANQATTSSVDTEIVSKFATMARDDDSPVVRLYLASAIERMAFSDRWPILDGLVSHGEDRDDPNLPQMLWFGLEPMVPEHSQRALETVIQGKQPKLQEFVARRIVAGAVEGDPSAGALKASAIQDVNDGAIIAKVAPGFQVRNCGEGGVTYHESFRNAVAVQIHPLDPDTPSSLFADVTIPRDKTTYLKMRTSHHPHGDWSLKVLVSGKSVYEQIIGPKSMGPNEWLDLEIDLSAYAGQTVELDVQNFPNDWNNEWAYWNAVNVVSF
jgi:putative membrane-bound dehydrogenase-like protein